MREIKFRAWIAKDNEMQYGVSLNSLGQHAQQGEDAIIMQYTGLKDKNGKEIYEGDILEWTEDRNIKCEVKYNAPSFLNGGFEKVCLFGYFFFLFFNPFNPCFSNFNVFRFTFYSYVIKALFYTSH